MTQEILDGNKLIAEFMGLCLIDFTNSLNVTKKVWMSDDYTISERTSVNGTNIDGLIFHSSCDWLMPVVEKIEQIKGVNVYTSKTTHGEFSIEISYETPSYVGIQNNKSIFIKDKTLTKIESIYKAVVEFIKWYNLNIKDKNDARKTTASSQ